MSSPPKLLINLVQTMLDGKEPLLHSACTTFAVKDSELEMSDVFTVFDHPKPLGLSPGYLASGQLVSLAISDGKNCRIIEFEDLDAKNMGKRGPKSATKPQLSHARIQGRKLLQDRILCRDTGDLFAFDMAPLAMALYASVDLRVMRAVDIQSAFPDAANRKPLTIIKDTFNETSDAVKKISEGNIERYFLRAVIDPEDNAKNRMIDLGMRAWISQFLVVFENGEIVFEKVRRIDTRNMPSQQLEMIAKVSNDSHRLDSSKPYQSTHRVKQGINPETGELRLDSQDYNSKLRTDKKISVRVTNSHGQFTVNGDVAAVSGRAGYLDVNERRLADKTVTLVTTTGRDNPTTAEAERAATILRILQGSDSILDDQNPWVRNIWFPSAFESNLVWPSEWIAPASPISPKGPSPQWNPVVVAHLNASQQTAINSMLDDRSPNYRITIIQGPPGTGKTSVIASFVHMHTHVYHKTGVWLVAQSNVAVKNIAEKLIRTGFTNWKLLVSKDFHFDWHEHLYTEVKAYIVRSDNFLKTAKSAKLNNISVILCTLSMLSNFHISKFTQFVPFTTLVVDEASQIEIGNYIPVFDKFKNTLRKVCFIGDDKQLPPHGQETLQDLQSIFELTHLRKNILFLDTQYRMPPQIGRIISKAIYNDQLKSNPLHPITDKVTACYFIDVALGKEQPLHNGSFKNILECQAVIQLAKILQELERNFKIITPYAGQTTFIEETLRENGLNADNKCFNVDSFQGNEEDYIIISVVRSRGIGFLTNDRRTNVLLSRCKKGMFIISSRQFLKGLAKDTLVGQFLQELEPASWLTSEDIETGNFYTK